MDISDAGLQQDLYNVWSEEHHLGIGQARWPIIGERSQLY